jgi:nicotinamidase-related amidase
VFCGIGGFIFVQKDFVDPAMRSPMLVAGGEAVVPAVAEAVAVARERGIFLVWVSFAITNSAFPGVILLNFSV